MAQIIDINKEGIEYFNSEWSKVFNPNDIELRSLRQPSKIKPTKHPEDLRYYPFTWGVVIERRLSQLVIWDICLNKVQKISSSTVVEQVKSHIFVLLKNIIPEYTDEEPIMFNELSSKWVVYPGAKFSEITVGFKIEDEDIARKWMGSVMLASLVNEVLQAIYISQNDKKTPLTA